MMRKYDLVFSLGGNCSVAHNLKIRHLRRFSLPLDWTYMVDSRPLEWLVSAIDNRMEGFCLKENLEEILPSNPEYHEDAHIGHRKYIDKATGYRFINHFSCALPFERAYNEGIAKIHRRIARLYDSFERFERFLMIAGVGFPVGDEVFKSLKSKLGVLYPGKTFDMEIVEFNATKDGVDNISDGILRRRFARDWNRYDCEGKNFEWHFMDDIKLPRRVGTRGQISFHIWPKIKCFIRFQRQPR